MVAFTVIAVSTLVTGGKEGRAGAGAAAGVGASATIAPVVAPTGGGAAVGTAIGGAAATSSGVGSSGVGLGAFVASTGGWALLAVGTSVSEENHITYDCWKPVVHDISSEPSNGMLLKDMACHPNIAKFTVSPGTLPELPNIVVENIWKEMFEIEYFWLHDIGRIVCHAKPVCM